MGEFHQRYDLLLTPMMPVPALPVGQDLNDPAIEDDWIDWSPFSYPFNLTRQPAASIPCGLTRAGLPIGLQIVGPLYAEDRVLRAARAFEQTQPERRSAAGLSGSPIDHKTLYRRDTPCRTYREKPRSSPAPARASGSASRPRWPRPAPMS